MNNVSINEVSSHKHLGIFLSNDGIWHEHINCISSKAWIRLNVMRKLKFILDRKSLESTYTCFIRPILEYADVIWVNCTQYEINALEKNHIEAARIVTGTTKLVSLDKLYQETGWETLEERRKKHKPYLFYKMSNNLSPNYLSSLVSPSIETATFYTLRDASNIRYPMASTQLHYKSFLSSSIRYWNELAPVIRDSSSIQSFEYQLNKNLT